MYLKAKNIAVDVQLVYQYAPRKQLQWSMIYVVLVTLVLIRKSVLIVNYVKNAALSEKIISMKNLWIVMW